VQKAQIPFVPRREEALNSTFSQSEFTLDQGERLLKGMQELREELNGHGAAVARLAERAQEVRPVKLRRAPVTRPLRAETVCAYKHANVSLTHTISIPKLHSNLLPCLGRHVKPLVLAAFAVVSIQSIKPIPTGPAWWFMARSPYV
jgi:hypothetical protein